MEVQNVLSRRSSDVLMRDVIIKFVIMVGAELHLHSHDAYRIANVIVPRMMRLSNASSVALSPAAFSLAMRTTFTCDRSCQYGHSTV